MTPEERQLLSALAQRVKNIPPQQKDPEAEQFIPSARDGTARHALRAGPDGDHAGFRAAERPITDRRVAAPVERDCPSRAAGKAGQLPGRIVRAVANAAALDSLVGQRARASTPGDSPKRRLLAMAQAPAPAGAPLRPRKARSCSRRRQAHSSGARQALRLASPAAPCSSRASTPCFQVIRGFRARPWRASTRRKA